MHQHFREKLDDYLMDRLSSAERREFAQHLRNCSDCDAAFAEAAATRSYLAWLAPSDAPPVPGPGFYLRVQQSIDEKKSAGWFANIAATLHPRFAYPLLFFLLLVAAWTLSFQIETADETIFGIPPTRFTATVWSEADRLESREMVMMNLIEMEEGE